MPTFVIEHLEPELFEWCLLEYKHISVLVGKENLLFTNVSNKEIEKFGKINPKSILDLELPNACILDPNALDELTPEIAKKFDNFIFGGILGDNPPKARTKDISEKLPYPKFNLGKDQFSTDTAVIVTKLICEGKKLEELEFQKGVDIEINETESVHLPYKYLVIDGKVLLPSGLVDMLKKQHTF